MPHITLNSVEDVLVEVPQESVEAVLDELEAAGIQWSSAGYKCECCKYANLLAYDELIADAHLCGQLPVMASVTEYLIGGVAG